MEFPRLDSWIHDSYRISPEGLALYRIFFGLYTLMVIAPGHDLYASLRTLAVLPATMFVPPPGPMMFFETFPGPAMVELLHFGVNLSLVALTAGFRTRISSIATGLLLLLLYGFSYSLGKVNHNLLFVLLPVLMSFSNWGAALSFDSRFRTSSRRVESWPLTMLAVLLGFAMFTAGFAKVIGGWLDPGTQAAYGHMVKHFVVRGRTDLLAPFLINVRSSIAWEAFDYATVVFEVGFLIAAMRARWTRLFAGFAVLFHLGVMLMLNIAFAFNLVVYAAFVDWDRVHRSLGKRRMRLALPLLRVSSVPVALPILFFGGVIFYWIGSPLLWFDHLVQLESDLSIREVLTVSCAALLVLMFGLRTAHSWFSRRIRT